MERKGIPSAGEFYRHFKGNLYQIIGVAKHSETGEKMVVYQALYGDYSLYVRPLDMFISPVDKEKYPDAAQEYRFEQVVPENGEYTKKTPTTQTVPVVPEEMQQEIPAKAVNEECGKNVDDEEQVRTEILRFLDAEGAEEKLKVLRDIRNELDEELLTTIELSLDLLPDEKESLERRFDLVERTLEKRVRFEGGRLR